MTTRMQKIVSICLICTAAIAWLATSGSVKGAATTSINAVHHNVLLADGDGQESHGGGKGGGKSHG